MPVAFIERQRRWRPAVGTSARSRCGLLIFVLALGCVSLEKRPETNPPNIVVIVVDDLGYGDLSVHGSKDVRTPNIDSIARDGVRFTQGYASSPVCAPTRAGLLTGRYASRFGYTTTLGSAFHQMENDRGVPTSEVFLSEHLRRLGYRTGAIGKWHLGVNEKYRPMNRGFDEFFGFLGGAHHFWNWSELHNPIYRDHEPTTGEKHLSFAFSEEAADFIARHRTEPFFLYLAYNAVHVPLQPPSEYLKRFSKRANLSQTRRSYLAQVEATDAAVGIVLSALRRYDLDDDTLLILLGDNGGTQRWADNSPLRGHKGTLLEGGIRVPFFARWPRELEASRSYEAPVVSMDVFSTALAAAGGRPPEDRPIDGVDLLPFLNGTERGHPHETLYWKHRRRSAIRTGSYKLVQKGSAEWLFDVVADPGEKANLASSLPELAAELAVRLDRWKAQQQF